MAVTTSQEKNTRMQPLSGVLKNVCSESFRDSIFSSVTVEVFSNPYGSKAQKERLIERTRPEDCLNNFFAGLSLSEKSPNMEIFWIVFPRIWTEHTKIRTRKTPYLEALCAVYVYHSDF